MQTLNVPQYDIIGWVEKAVVYIWSILPGIIENFLTLSIVIAIPTCIMFLIGIIVAVERRKAIRRKEEIIYNPKIEESYNESIQGDPTLTLRWKQITEHLETTNPNDWKQAVMEADIILGEILDKMGYQGEGIGEKLRRVEKADFQTLDQAWEAHKIRNIIAHEGASYDLTQYEAKRVISLYRQVFEEFFYI
jgi:hypothetical protein